MRLFQTFLTTVCVLFLVILDLFCQGLNNNSALVFFYCQLSSFPGGGFWWRIPQCLCYHLQEQISATQKKDIIETNELNGRRTILIGGRWHGNMKGLYQLSNEDDLDKNRRGYFRNICYLADKRSSLWKCVCLYIIIFHIARFPLFIQADCIE